MRARLLAIALLVIYAVGPAVPALAQSAGTADVAETIAAVADMDGTVVTVEGEAIGEALRAPGGEVWVNVLDDDTAIGIVMTRDQARAITTYGEWSRRGDRVRVTGVVNEACSEHGGDLDMHADSVVVIARGSVIERPVQPWKAVVAALATTGTLLLFRAYTRPRRRSQF